MRVVNTVDVPVWARCFVLGAGFGNSVQIPPDRLGLVHGPHKRVALLGGANCYEFPGEFMIVPYAGSANLGMLELPERSGQLWHRLEGVHAWLHVWADGVVHDLEPPR
jgi:hypothetical protein